jgi:hypothetical protein
MGYTLMQGMWENFWFKPIDARQYAALRICFGGLSAVYLLGLIVALCGNAVQWLGLAGEYSANSDTKWR